MSINEKDIVGSPEPVSLSGTQTILNQMRNCIFKIKVGNIVANGFFCTIPYGSLNTLNCLITNNHVLKEKYYEENNKLTLLLDDENATKVIDLTMERKTYFNHEYDIALIEILDKDKIEHFLEFDELLKKDQKLIEEVYKNSSIYVIQYLGGKKAHVSYGLIKEINKFEIKHLCCTKNGSSGSPILNLENNKIIGLHKSAYPNDNLNGGTLLKVLLDNIEFKTKQNKKNMNEIIIDEPKSIDEQHDNKGSWMYIFNEVINNFKFEKNQLSEIEINEMVKDKIKEIKLLHKIFKIFLGTTENSKFKNSIENLLNLMTSFTIGIFPFKKEKGSKNIIIDFHEIEIWIKGKIKKNLTIREQYDAKQNLDKINKILFGGVINNIYNDNMEETLGNIFLLSTCKILGKMIVDNIFSYATEKELNKVFEKIAIEIILDIKDKNKYKNQFILFNGEYLLSSKLYPKIVNKFYSLINKRFYKEKEIKENEDLEKELINFIKHDLIAILQTLGIICPIKYSKIPWI